jgi:hypothetical protein
LSVALASCLLLLVAPVARGSVFTGTCVLNLTFNFDSPIKAAALSQGRNVSYSISASPAADLNPLDGGSQPCVVDTNALNPFRPTDASGSGQAIAWTCEAAAGTGSWDQSWTPDPVSVSGAHAITGTWGNWHMVVNNASLSFTGSMDLTVAASDATKLSQCAGAGISSLRMTGVMHFQDPEMPPV